MHISSSNSSSRIIHQPTSAAAAPPQITSPKRSSQEQSQDLPPFGMNENISNEKRQPESLEYPPNEILDSTQQLLEFTLGFPPLSQSKIEGPIFKAGEAEWQVLIHPSGTEKKGFVSVFLKLVSCLPSSSSNRRRYSIPAAFSFEALKDSNSPEPFHTATTHYRFNEDSGDWGFAHFLPHSMLLTDSDSETCSCPVFIRLTLKILTDPSGMRWAETLPSWNSYRETGYLGIRNQGATCYMNSLLQSLFFTNSFRALIYAIPTEGDRPGESLIISLQKLFCQLHMGGESGIPFADTTDLTRSFGWGFMEAIEHHDIQEFSKKLQDSVERKLKEAKIADPFEQTFGGKLVSIIKCINVDYQSRNLETFHEILLSIQPGNMRASLEAYTEMERIEGENGLQVEGFGKQDILKGVKFQSLPPVLHFQLLRFVFDFSRETTVKLNDRFEFPPSIDMRDFIDGEPEEGTSYIYNLHGVLVHCGESNVGHYYSFLKPTPEGGWFKFDDERVTPASEQEAINDNYGQSPISFDQSSALPFKESSKSRLVKRFTNAYMLVYIRESEYPRVLAPISPSQIPSHVIAHDEAERKAEREKKEKKLEEMTTIKIRLADKFTIRNHEGLGFCSFGKDENSSTTIKLPRDRASTRMIINRISEDSGIPTERIRLWEVVSTRGCKFSLSPNPIAVSDILISPGGASSFSPGEKKFFVEYLFEESGPEDLEDVITFIKVFSSNSTESSLSVISCLKINPNAPLGSAVLQGIKESTSSSSSSNEEELMQNIPKDIKIALECKNSTLLEDLPFDSTLAQHQAAYPGAILILYQEPQDPNENQRPGIFYSLGSLEGYFTYLTTKKVYTFINSQEAENSFRAEVSCMANLDQILGIISFYCDGLPTQYIRCFLRDEDDEIRHLSRDFTIAHAPESRVYFYTLPQDQFTPEEAGEIVNLTNLFVWVTSRGSFIELEGEYFLKGSESLHTGLTPRIYAQNPKLLTSCSCSQEEGEKQLGLGYFLIPQHESQAKISHWWTTDGTVSEIQEALVSSSGRIYVQQIWGNMQVPAFHMCKTVGNSHSFPFILSLPSGVKVGELGEILIDQFDRITEREAKACRICFEDCHGKIWNLSCNPSEPDCKDQRPISELWPLKWLGFDHPEPYRPQKSMKIL